MRIAITMMCLFAWIALATAGSEERDPTPTDARPEKDLGEAKVERPVRIEKPTPSEERWAKASHGVLGQCFEAANPLEPLSPLASPEAGYGLANLSRDTVTRRVMGLQFLRFEF